jgi:hypothetical protein
MIFKRMGLFLFCIYYANVMALPLPHVVRQKVCLGQTSVVIQRENYGVGKLYVHLHANETTALKAARKVAALHGGQVITLVHKKTRDVHFVYHGRQYAFDPNRIFTPKGLRLTLKKHHCNDEQARQIVACFAKQILSTIPKGKIVAVHNNNGYSLLDYLPKHSLYHDARKLFYKKQSNYRNFFLVTKIKDFKRYKALGWNVIHQAPKAQDDGSLSILMAKRHYINVEAGYGELKSQIQMLKLA